MFRHLFTLIWNKKKQNFLLLTEIFVSFLILFGIFSMMVNYYFHYSKPMGFEYKNVWVINYGDAYNTNSNDSLVKYYQNIEQGIRNMPEVNSVSYSNFYHPFSDGVSETTVSYKGHDYDHTAVYMVQEDYRNVLQIKLLDGRWFEKQDRATATSHPVVINETLKKKIFGNESAVGKLLYDRLVIGVAQDMKMKGDYSEPGNGAYFLPDSAGYRNLGHMLVRVNPGIDPGFESRLYKYAARAMPNANVSIEHLTDKRRASNRMYTTPMTIALIIAAFLIINVSLGIFGVLWYNINKRRAELGLRRAIGASGRSVATQLASEAMILTTLALVVGVFFAVQIPLLNVFGVLGPSKTVFFTAIVLAILFIYVLVLLCSIYPGKQAAGIYPAVALHEN